MSSCQRGLLFSSRFHSPPLALHSPPFLCHAAPLTRHLHQLSSHPAPSALCLVPAPASTLYPFINLQSTILRRVRSSMSHRCGVALIGNSAWTEASPHPSFEERGARLWTPAMVGRTGGLRWLSEESLEGHGGSPASRCSRCPCLKIGSHLSSEGPVIAGGGGDGSVARAHRARAATIVISRCRWGERDEAMVVGVEAKLKRSSPGYYREACDWLQ